jgi:aminodeoxyfutalosine deaminase
MLELAPPAPVSTGLAPVIHRARWVVVSPDTILENGSIRVENDIIMDVGTNQDHGYCHVMDHGEVVLMPALVNAHTHLELSALKGQTAPDKGFREWVKQILELREALGLEALMAGVDQGIKELAASGCGAIGEISTLGITGKPFAASGLGGVWFKEFIGSDPDYNPGWYHGNGHCNISLAGHAPHTTAPSVLQILKTNSLRQKLPFSIHLAESEDELDFIRNGSGAWADFLTQRGIDYSDWGLPCRSPIQHLENMRLLDPKTLAVHLIHTDEEDLRILGQRKTHVCLCPRSNLSLHDRLPNIKQLAGAGISLCLGTDSLASVPTLSIFDEMACLAENCSFLSPREILAMATVNGAAALGVEDLHGTLAPGKTARFLKIPLKASNKKQLLEKLIYHRPAESRRDTASYATAPGFSLEEN